MGVVAAVMGILGILPGMPHFIFLSFAVLFGGLAYVSHQRIKQKVAADKIASAKPMVNEELEWKDVPIVEPLCLELAKR